MQLSISSNCSELVDLKSDDESQLSTDEDGNSDFFDEYNEVMEQYGADGNGDLIGWLNEAFTAGNQSCTLNDLFANL